MPSPVSLQVVVCTYNRARELDQALAALARQTGAEAVDWSVLVVDNASTDATPAVVDSWRDRLPGLRRVREDEQGLTPARRRGVLESRAEWIAFVDDDNLLEPDWIANMAAEIAARPDAGGFGGRIVLEFPVPPPPFLGGFGFCFAEQDHGPEAREIHQLAGAGMVLNRAALRACGWLDQPLLADRVGRRLVSGGDVEMSHRVRGAGFPLWYAPRCVLRHQISAGRMTRSYLWKVNTELGASETMINALSWPGAYAAWVGQAWDNTRRKRRWALGELRRAALRRRGLTAALAWLAFSRGMARGIRAVEAMSFEHRAVFFGAAAPKT